MCRQITPADDKRLIIGLFSERDKLKKDLSIALAEKERLKAAYRKANRESEDLRRQLREISIVNIADKFEFKHNTIKSMYSLWHQE